MERWLSWSKAHDWKSCRAPKALKGSNPFLSATNPCCIAAGVLSCLQAKGKKDEKLRYSGFCPAAYPVRPAGGQLILQTKHPTIPVPAAPKPGCPFGRKSLSRSGLPLAPPICPQDRRPSGTIQRTTSKQTKIPPDIPGLSTQNSPEPRRDFLSHHMINGISRGKQPIRKPTRRPGRSPPFLHFCAGR